MDAIDFMRKASYGEFRIVSSGDLTEMQVAQAQATGRFFVDPVLSLGWALLPWELTTDKDRARERSYFSRTNQLVNVE